MVRRKTAAGPHPGACPGAVSMMSVRDPECVGAHGRAFMNAPNTERCVYYRIRPTCHQYGMSYDGGYVWGSSYAAALEVRRRIAWCVCTARRLRARALCVVLFHFRVGTECFSSRDIFMEIRLRAVRANARLHTFVRSTIFLARLSLQRLLVDSIHPPRGQAAHSAGPLTLLIRRLSNK